MKLQERMRVLIVSVRESQRNRNRNMSIMTDCIIAMRSQTYAAKGKRILSKNGIFSEIVNIDPSLTRNGCSYGLQLDGNHCGTASAILTEHHIAYGDILGKGGYPL